MPRFWPAILSLGFAQVISDRSSGSQVSALSCSPWLMRSDLSMATRPVPGSEPA